MKRISIVISTILLLSACGTSPVATNLAVNIRLIPPAAPFRAAQADNVPLYQANGVLQLRLSLTNAAGQQVSAKTFGIEERTGLFEGVPTGDLALKGEGLDLTGNVIYIDNVTVTIVAQKENTTSVGLTPIPAITTCAKNSSNTNKLDVVGIRFLTTASATIDGNAASPSLRTGTLVQLDITSLAAGAHKVVIINDTAKVGTNSGECSFTK